MMGFFQPLLAAQFGHINMEDLMDSFRIMGEGMGGIFVVLILIALIVLLLTKLTSRKPKQDEKKSEEQ